MNIYMVSKVSFQGHIVSLTTVVVRRTSWNGLECIFRSCRSREREFRRVNREKKNIRKMFSKNPSSCAL